jgi:hypothetical protein
VKSQENVIRTIFLRFPDKKKAIKSLFEKSESFRVICKDYYDCKSMVDKFTQDSNKTCDLQREYKILMEEIEDELFKQITK